MTDPDFQGNVWGAQPTVSSESLPFYANPQAESAPQEDRNGNTPPENTRPTRAEIRSRRRIEQVVGVPLRLDHDDFVAKVRLLNVFERTTLQGLPPDFQALMLRGFNQEDFVAKAGNRTVKDMFNIVGIEEDSASMACVHGFIWPRLVATQQEADAANSTGDLDTWWVEDLHLDDRKKYLRLIMGQDAEALKLVRNFLRTNTMAGV